MAKKSAWAVLAAALMACTPVGDRTQLSVGYYAVSGSSFEELDEQIALHGPRVSGVGRALAATSIRMIPDFRFSMANGRCQVSSARVSVSAHVTLPRLAEPRTMRRSVVRAWDDLESYARLHEAVHVSIADRYALGVERAVMALGPARECSQLRNAAAGIFRDWMVRHEAEQLRFDAEERERIARLIAGRPRTGRSASLEQIRRSDGKTAAFAVKPDAREP